MATFSVNQSKQILVANVLKTPVIATDSAGTISVNSDTAKNHLYFGYKGAETLMRSDLIPIKNITSVIATDASKMGQPLKAKLVTLDSSINSGLPIAGQDYILNIKISQYLADSDETPYFKYGMVHAYAGMSASNFYKTLALSLAKNFSREIQPLLAFKLTTATTPVDVTATTKASDLTGTYTGVYMTEVQQSWRLGVKPLVPVYYEVLPRTVIFQGDEIIWGVVADQTPSAVLGNGKKIADLEYFFMGERGDIYRGIGFPNNIPTKYLVNSDLNYNIIDINYYYKGNNEDIQQSSKTITIVVPKVGATNSVSNVLTNSIITAIGTATGLTLGTLDVSAA